MKKLFVAVLVMSLILSLAACGNGTSQESKTATSPEGAAQPADGQVYTLKLSTSQNESAPICQGFFELAELVKERTDGGLLIEVYPSSQLGNDEDVIEQAIQGAGVTVLTDAGRMGNYVNDMGVLLMAYFGDNYDELLAVTQSDIFAGWEKQLVEEDGIRVLSFNWYDGPRHFLTNKPINAPGDLNGQRIRTIGAPVCIESITALGATPISMAWGDVYSGIQSKAIDGCEAQSTSSYPTRIYEVADYLSKTGHFQLLNGLICGEKWFQSLPDEYQEILVDSCKEVAARNAVFVQEQTAVMEKQMAEEGIEIIEPDLAPFKAAAEQAYEKMGYTQLRERLYQEIGKA